MIETLGSVTLLVVRVDAGSRYASKQTPQRLGCRSFLTMRGAPRVDVVLGVVLTVLGVAEAVLGLTGVREPWYVVATVPFATLPVVVRRPRTALATGVLLAALIAQSLLGSDLPGGFTESVALILVVFSVGRVGLPRSGVLLAAVLVGLAVVIGFGEDPHPANFVYMATVVAAAWAAGLALRMAEERSELLAERSALRERARIAGELHDVVSHNVSAMVVQAGAERRDQPEGSETARTLADIEEHGRQTLTELRRLLGVLHVDPDGPALTPQPGIADIADLVHTASATGLGVRLATEGQPRPVGEGISLAVYRVVQEALTNVRKHSGAQEATVTLRWAPREVQVEVLDRAEPRRRLLPGSGFGLRAMAERVTTYGGTVSAGAVPGGFRVLATLPLEER
jgi:signal transduction histidine kinase